jgi:hypothetical protein
MITTLSRLATVSILLGFVTSTHAIPDVQLFPYQVGQVGTTAQAQVGLVVQGIGAGWYFTVGGGYTLTCQDSSSNLQAENFLPFFKITGSHSVTVAVPPVTPTRYEIAGFNSWALNTCHLCDFQHRGRAAEGSTSIVAGSKGVSFSFNPSGGLEATMVNVKQFNMCKLPPSSGIYRGCLP